MRTTITVQRAEWDYVTRRIRELEALLHKARHERDDAQRTAIQQRYALDAAHEELRRLKYGEDWDAGGVRR